MSYLITSASTRNDGSNLSLEADPSPVDEHWLNETADRGPDRESWQRSSATKGAEALELIQRMDSAAYPSTHRRRDPAAPLHPPSDPPAVSSMSHRQTHP